MKRLLTILMVFLQFVSSAQNYAPNYSFEKQTSCPTNQGEMSKCIGWTNSLSSSDYMSNICFPPANQWGAQDAKTGDAYTGLYTYSINSGNVLTGVEMIVGDLIPLQKGDTYRVTIHTSLADKSGIATNNIGVLFYKDGYSFVNNSVTSTPQIRFTGYGVISNDTDWVRLTTTFIADSAYEYIMIGGFPNSNGIDTSRVNNSSNNNYAYYFFDDIYVTRNNNLQVAFTDSLFCANDSFSLIYFTKSKFDTSNYFKAILSDKNGSFDSAVVIGTVKSDTSGNITCVIPSNVAVDSNYKIKVVSTNIIDTSIDNPVTITLGNLDSLNIDVVASDNGPLCITDTLKLIANSSVSGVSYSWTGPDNFTSNQQNPYISNVSLLNNGKHIVYASKSGCTDIDTTDVVIHAIPVYPTVFSNTPFCEPDTLQLSASTTTNGVTYSWSGPNSFSDTGSTIIIPVSADSMSGVYTATVTKNGCSSSDTTNVVVKPLPSAVTLSNNTPICEGDTLKLFSDTSTTGVTYAWTGPQSFSANTRNVTEPNTAPNMSGYYTMSVNLNGCKYIDSTQVNIYAVPAAPLITYDTLLCVGDTLNLTATSLTGATYNWTGPNNFNSNQKSPVRANITLSDTGTYTVIATNNICASPQASVYVTINPQPFVVILGSKDSICDGEQVNFTSFANNVGGTPTYQWYVNAQAVGTSASYSASNLKHNDIVKAEMTEYTKCENPYTDESNDIRMTVLPWLAPSVSIVSDKSGPVPPYHYITFTATATDAGNTPKYQWKRNGTDVIGAQGSTWSANTLSDNDSISVEVTSSYLCPQLTTATSNSITVRILTTVGEIEGLENLTLYPNPNNGQFVLEGTAKHTGQYTISILNSIGQLIHHNSLSVVQGVLHHNINLGAIPTGIYMLKLTDDSGNGTNIRFHIE